MKLGGVKTILKNLELFFRSSGVMELEEVKTNVKAWFEY